MAAKTATELKLKAYKNGNTIVAIGKDGTKIRYIPDNQVAEPEFPESIDLKITNRCSMGCPMCHENSVPDGEHADLNNPILDTLRPYTELAIGGGDPMSHPGLEEFLTRMKKKSVICNMTVHWKCFEQNFNNFKELTDKRLVNGLGVSINEVVPCEVMDMLQKIPNAVVHTIIGIANRPVFRQLMDRDLNILLLGYKTHGRGDEYIFEKNNYFSIIENINFIKFYIPEFYKHFRATSFDNLSVDQLKLKYIMDEKAFKKFYMGDDGTFTMYIDLVKNTYAVSSVSPQKPITCENITELFQDVRNSVHAPEGA